jgi:hypothetical protein
MTVKRLADLPAVTVTSLSYDYWMTLSSKHGGRSGLKRRIRAIDRRIDALTRERDDLTAATRNLTEHAE